MPDMNVKTEKFEGPFDLLFHLIGKNEIDIYDIPIALLTDQYIEYIKTFPEHDMESMSEFILMAATLIEIKSKMLLPKLVTDEGEEEDPRSELVRKLIEYKKYKGIVGFFKEREGEADMVYYKNHDDTLPQAELFMPVVDVDELLNGVSLDALYAAFEEVLKRRELKTDKVRSGFNSVQKDLYTVEEKVEHIQNLMRLYQRVSFSSIFSRGSRKMEKVVTFLALLELIKMKKAVIMQEQLFAEIYITGNDENETERT